jgi:hypothetical protein
VPVEEPSTASIAAILDLSQTRPGETMLKKGELHKAIFLPGAGGSPEFWKPVGFRLFA